MAKKKVLFVATVDSHIEAFHLPYLKMFKDRGYEVHVAANTDRPIKYCDKKICLPIRRNPFKVSNVKAIRDLKKVIDKEGYEVVHCHTPMGGVVSRLAGKKARRNGTRMIYTAHGFHFYTGAPLHYWLMFYPVEWYLAKFTDTLITINDEDYERANRRFSRRCHDIQYVPGVGVDEKKFKRKLTIKEKRELRKELGLDIDDKVLIFVGRLDKNKNQGFLIKVLKELLKKDDQYRLLLVGPDELDGKYQKLAKDLGVEKEVLFLGFRKDVPELIQIADVVVSASKREGLPVNLIEAGMAGLPIVALNCRGARDICKMVEDGVCVVDFGDISGFIKKVKGTKKDKRVNNVSVFGLKNVKEEMSKIYFGKKRILHILASRKFSGAENVACMIIVNLSNKFEMAYCSPEGPIKESLKERNIKYISIKKLNYRNFKKVVNEFKPDIIHAHDFRASLVASRFSKRCRIISHIHLDNPRVKKLSIWSIIYQFSSVRYKKIIWVSQSALDDYFFKSSKDFKNKSIVLRNVVDKNYIRLKANEYNVDDRYDLIFLGRLSEQKDPERMLSIVKLIKQCKNDIKIAVVGDGDMRETIKKLVVKNGLDNSVEMFGFVDNPYPILKNSKIMLMTSKYEGTPMAILEAQALGKPVVSTKIEGFKGLIVNGKNGYLYDDDILLASEKILDYLKERRYEKLSNNSKKIFDKNNDKEKYLKVILRIYES